MTENFKQVWKQIEEEIGGCCLHKKAAYSEVIGGQVQQLTLVTSASKELIERFIGDRKTENPQDNRYVFAYEGVQIDLTTYEDIEDLDLLYEKSFRQALTIDSLGVRRDGMVSDGYGGLEDIKTKTLRLTEPKVIISEILFRRMLGLVLTEGYRMDQGLSSRIETDKLLEKESYRRRFCETLIGATKGKARSWNNVADLLDTLVGTYVHQPSIIEYTRGINKPFSDERFTRTFLYLIFALAKVTARELEDLMPGEATLQYFDSLAANLYKNIGSAAAFRSMKEKYGSEFLELLFDLQELWSAMENIPYKRPTERDFDRMNLIQSDDSRWVDPHAKSGKKPQQVVHPPIEEQPEKYQLEGTMDFARTMNPNYNEEEYDEPMEGTVVDDYTDDSLAETEPSAPVMVEKTAHSGFDTSGLDVMESELQRTAPTSTVAEKTKKDGIINHFKGHTGKMLGK